MRAGSYSNAGADEAPPERGHLRELLGTSSVGDLTGLSLGDGLLLAFDNIQGNYVEG